jgi:hypothetical protein
MQSMVAMMYTCAHPACMDGVPREQQKVAVWDKYQLGFSWTIPNL